MKSLLYKILFPLFICVSSVNLSQAALLESEQTVNCFDQVVAYANENLPLYGTLQVGDDGFGYIKVDDEYIHTLEPLLGLQEEGFKKPPYFRSKNSAGAHISVFYVDEEITPTEEMGHVFQFSLDRIVVVHAGRSAKFAVLQVTSPELEQLRTKYGLQPKLHGHEFHITIAKKTIRN